MNTKLNRSDKFLPLAVVACALLLLTNTNIFAQKKIEIIKVTLKPEKTEYKGGCPVKILFTGSISIVRAGGTGTVRYSFERSDGAKTLQISELLFKDLETEKKIETTWTLGKSFTGWIIVKTYEPQTNKLFASSQRDGGFSLRCTTARTKPGSTAKSRTNLGKTQKD